MNQHEKGVLTEALQADADSRREEMRQQEQAFVAVVFIMCAIIISCMIIGAGFLRVSQMIEARQAQEVRK